MALRRLAPSAIDGIPAALAYTVSSIILGWITWKIFANLYHCRCRSVLCYPVFSHRHNWPIEPSRSNKIYALLSATMLAVSSIAAVPFFIVYAFVSAQQSPVISSYFTALSLVGAIGRVFYFLYLISALEYQMEQEALIRNMVSPKWITVLKFGQWISLLPVVAIYTLYAVPGVYEDAEAINYALLMILRGCSEIVLAWLHFKGLNYVCAYWKSKEWKEYEQYGETQKIHEVLNIITRSSVVITASLAATIVSIFAIQLSDYCYHSTASQRFCYSVATVADLFHSVDDITYGLSTYFIYPFGYNSYRKCCQKCHDLVYSCFKSRLQQQNDMRYVAQNDYVLMDDVNDDIQP